MRRRIPTLLAASTLISISPVTGLCLVPFAKGYHRQGSYCASLSHSYRQTTSGRRHMTARNAADKDSSPGWRRIKKVFGRKQKDKSLNLNVAAIEEPTKDTMADFILRNFEQESPATLFPPTTSSGLLDASLDVLQIPPLVTTEVVAPAIRDVANSKRSVPLRSDKDASIFAVPSSDDDDDSEGGPFNRLSRSVGKSVLTGLLDKWSRGSHVNLNVQCEPTGTPLDLLKGHFRTDASVDFDRIIFRCIQMSGGRLELHRLALNLWSFTPDMIPINSNRYPNQFDFVAHNVTFTQADLFESSCIRNGLRRLLTRILKKQGLGTTTVTINSISILPTGKVACQGDATMTFGPPVPFEVRSGVGITGRGHVLTFPGLEISLNPSLGLHVPVLPSVSLDLGHNAQLLQAKIDGREGKIRVSAKATITPHHTLKLHNYIQASNAYSAQYSFDVGRWLTRIGNFTK